LVYILILKEIRKNSKLFIKTNKDIFIRYESDNNYLIYFPNQNKIINIKNYLIKEDLIYSDDYNLIENDYISLEGLEITYNSDDVYGNNELEEENNIIINNNNSNNNNSNSPISDVPTNSSSNNESPNEDVEMYNASPDLEEDLDKLSLDYNKFFKK
jgi:hypothetical protein